MDTEELKRKKGTNIPPACRFDHFCLPPENWQPYLQMEDSGYVYLHRTTGRVIIVLKLDKPEGYQILCQMEEDRANKRLGVFFISLGDPKPVPSFENTEEVINAIHELITKKEEQEQEGGSMRVEGEEEDDDDEDDCTLYEAYYILKEIDLQYIKEGSLETQELIEARCDEFLELLGHSRVVENTPPIVRETLESRKNIRVKRQHK
jgi:hypothetical protein